jgi:hypothetical protein
VVQAAPPRYLLRGYAAPGRSEVRRRLIERESVSSEQGSRARPAGHHAEGCDELFWQFSPPSHDPSLSLPNLVRRGPRNSSGSCGRGSIRSLGSARAMARRSSSGAPRADASDWVEVTLGSQGDRPQDDQKIASSPTNPDPFKINRLDNMIESVKKDLPRLGLPMPTHTAIEVPYERGDDIEVVWIGVAVHKNLRDIFEVNRARTGEELDPARSRILTSTSGCCWQDTTGLICCRSGSLVGSTRSSRRSSGRSR